MNKITSTLTTGFFFAGLLIGTSIQQINLKPEPLLLMILFGMLALVSQVIKHKLKTSIPFYSLLGLMAFISIYLLSNLIIENFVLTNINEDSHPLMQSYWMWGVITGIILAPLTVFLYFKKAARNVVLEISLTSFFIAITTLIYISKEIL